MFFIIDWLEKKTGEIKEDWKEPCNKSETEALDKKYDKGDRHSKLWVQYWDYDD